MRERDKLYRQRPEVKERRRKAALEYSRRSEVREKHNLAARKRYQDPEYRAAFKAKQKAYSQTPRAKELARLRRQTAKNKQYMHEYRQEWFQKNRYGFSMEQWKNMLAEQGERCALCHVPFSEFCRPHTDHLVVDGKPVVRGLLCRECNVGLGIFKESPRLLMAAIDYITDFQLRMDSVPTARLAAAKPAGGVQ